MAKRVRFAVGEVERAARFELTMPDLQSGALTAWRRAHMILERKERFELSKRVWKTRMLPATSLPLV